jgi:hypothetical protein
VYGAAQGTAGTVHYFGVPFDGSAAPVRLTPPLVDGGSVYLSALTPDGLRFVFVADSRVLLVGDLDTNDTLELYESFLERVQAPRKERTRASSQAPGGEHGPVSRENGR